MSFFVKVFETLSAPSEEDAARQNQRVYVLKRLKQTSKRILSSASVGEHAGRIRSSDPFAEQLCNDILACFRHGLKPGKGGFWAFTFECCKNILSAGPSRQTEPFLDSVQSVDLLEFVKTPEGKSRAWVRQVLNVKATADSIAAMLKQESSLLTRYEPWSLMRCSKGSQLLISMIAPLAIFDFCFDVDIALFDHQDFPSLPDELVLQNATSQGRTKPTELSQSEQDIQNRLWDSKAASTQHASQRNRSSSETKLSSALSFISRTAQSLTKEASSALDVMIDGMSTSKRLGEKCGFGMPLSVTLRTPHRCRHAFLEPRLGIPRLAEQCLNALESNMDTEGLFQVNAPEAEILALKEAYGAGRSLPTALFSAHAISGLLMSYLMSFPDYLIPAENRLALIVAGSEIEDSDARNRNLGFMLREMPWEYQPLLVRLIEFFRRVASPEHAANNGSSPAGIAGILADIMFNAREHRQQNDNSVRQNTQSSVAVLDKVSNLSEFEKAKKAAYNILTGDEKVLGAMKSRLEKIKASLDRKVQYLRATYDLQFKPFNGQNPKHVANLRIIWNLLIDRVEGPMPDPRPPFSLHGGMWSRFGFRGSDPTVDLRGGGMYALEQLVYMYEKYTDKILSLLKWYGETTAHSPLHAYPIVMTFVRCTRVVTEIAGLAEKKPTGIGATTRGTDKFSINSLSHGPCWGVYNEGHVADGELCAFAFLLHDQAWRQEDSHFVDFEPMLEKTRDRLIHLLKQRPADTSALWRLWIDDKMKQSFGSKPVAHPVPTSEKSGVVILRSEEEAERMKKDLSSSTDPPCRQPTLETGPGSPVQQPSYILNADTISFLVDALPSSCKDYSWVRTFSLGTEGKSFSHFSRKIKGYVRSLIVIKDSAGAVFGGFASEPWDINLREDYYGTGECFVFSLKPTMGIFRWTTRNSLFMMFNDLAIAMGGGGSFSFYLDRDLFNGSSGPCETFGSPMLSSKEKFTCVDLEVWTFSAR